MSKKDKKTQPTNNTTHSNNDAPNNEQLIAENDQYTQDESQDKSQNDSLTATEQLVRQNEELKDKYLRLYAEFENYKRRTIKEKMEMIRNASQDTITSLLPVMDDFDRAAGSEEGLSEGMQLIHNKLRTTLEQKGLKAMNSTHQPFDPELHEAVTEIPAPSEDLVGKVVDTIEKGYILNDKIIRHAKVVVGR